MSEEWDGKVVSSTPWGPIVEMSLGDLLARKDAEIERQARHIEELREKIDAEKSCACSFDAPGDVCAAHSPFLTRALAEVERQRAEIERLREVIRTIRARCVELDDSDAVSETLDIATAVLEDEPCA